MSGSSPHSKPDVKGAMEEIIYALETLRDCGDRPGMYEDGKIALEHAATVQAELSRLQEQFDASEKYAAEGWAWLNEALEALGAGTVFDIAQRKERIQQLKRDNGRLALEAATADQDWKRAEAEVEKLKHALTQVRAECDLPDYIAEFVGEALNDSLTPSSSNVRKSWGPERMRHDPEPT